MSDLQELYQSIILDHNRRPKNYGALDEANHRAEVRVELRRTDDRIEDVRFTSAGCAVSRAAASIMTQSVKGKTREDIDRLFAQFHGLVTGKVRPTEQEARALGELAAFAGVARFPIRVKCASMPWHVLQAALRSDASPAADAA